MEEWERDFKWLEVRHFIKESLDREELPDFNGILLLIGIQELGRVQKSFTKEEKQDLMHIAACSLLEQDGYYKFQGRDEDGWPHYKQLKPFTLKGVNKQTDYLKLKIIHYFADAIKDNE